MSMSLLTTNAFDNMSISKKIYEELRKSTVRIKYFIQEPNKNEVIGISNGTGFICNTTKDEKPFIISNKHLIDKEFQGIKLTQDTTFTHHFIFETWKHQVIAIINPNWILHKSYDLAALPMDIIESQAKKRNAQLNHKSISMEQIADTNFMLGSNPIEKIVMPTYLNDLPLCFRSGKTATPLYENVKMGEGVNEDPHNTPFFVIDCGSTPGSSGSPIYNIKGPENDVKLIGVLFKGYNYIQGIGIDQKKKYTETEKQSIKALHNLGVFDFPRIELSSNFGVCIKSDTLLSWFQTEGRFK